MEREIKKMYFKDCVVVLLTMIILWVILSFVIINAMSIASNHLTRILVLSTGILVGAFSTASSMEVIVHLKKNQKEVYTEEILG